MIFENKVLSIYKKKLLQRRDPDGLAHVFMPHEFEGLRYESYTFEGDKGQTLSARLYYRGEPRRDRLIMLDHGMGCGHNSYLKEIDVITAEGYTVFTYDHTGTMLSGGEDIGGFSQSLSDLDRAVKFVRSLPEYKDASLAVIGHSWGGFSTMNIPALHPEISHVVALSGFISTKAIQDQVSGGLLRIYRPMLYKLEHDRLPDYADYDGRKSLTGAKTKALILHSKDDRTCLYNHHFKKMKKALCDSENVTFISLEGKVHHPQYTSEAVKYKLAYAKDRRQRQKSGRLDTDEAKQAFVNGYDFHKMHEQDMELWQRIFEFLEG